MQPREPDMIRLTSKQLYLAAIATVIVSNLALFATAFYNRSGDQLREISLSQRELPLLRPGYESSNLSFGLTWNIEQNDLSKFSHYPAWLDTAKLISLGFDPESLEAKTSRNDERQVFLALEFNGNAYQRTLERAQKHLLEASEVKRKRAEEQFRHWQTTASRLFVIDADVTLDTLKARYTDQPNIIFIKGIVSARYSSYIKAVTAYIDTSRKVKVNMPLPIRQALGITMDAIKNSDEKLFSLEYDVVLAFGLRLEPWIVSARLRDTKP